MTQNIYDNEQFFEAYGRLSRSVEGLDGAPEWPALQVLLPNMRGLSILDLGCGFGWFCRWAQQQGAARVVGIDVSERMLTRAKATTQDPAISYSRADLEDLALPSETFDVIYSSLAFHYIANFSGLLAVVHRSLVRGGNLVFSVEHPVFTAPAKPAWSVTADGRKTWPLDGYLNEGPRSTDWLVPGVIKQHRTLATYVNLLLRQGFVLSHLEEWGPTAEQIAERHELADERHRPPFLLVAARR
jgi:SAM-dependent methyltransferase